MNIQYKGNNFLEFIENINQLRIGFYLIILNMVLIFVLSNQKQKT